MRPIVRGECPTDSNNQNIQFTTYTEARGELINRLGEYCSYCEMQLDSSLAVEHVKPKKPQGSDTIDTSRLLDWNNFLLSCTNCNSTKGNKDVILDEYFWPDLDNTFQVLTYSEGGVISPAPNLDDQSKEKVKKTISLTGLNKNPGNDPRASDRRWQNRRETWDIAVESKKGLEECNTVQLRKQIIETAKAKGFWSIWMTVFKNDPDMLQRFIKAFPGTCEPCFDDQNEYLPIPRR